jgi:hypothetical protein
MFTKSLSNSSIIVNQNGINSIASMPLNPQAYAIFIDAQKVGVLNGYESSLLTSRLLHNC